MKQRRFLVVLLVLAPLLAVLDSVRGQDLTGLYLTWRNDPSSTIVVNWVNLYEQGSRSVFFRELGKEDWIGAEAEQLPVGPSTLVLRRVELTGLSPDTTYELGIGSRPATPAESWRFRTMPRSLTRPVRFVSGGDMMHRREWLDRMNRIAASLEPDFALLGGDLAYGNGVLAMNWVEWLQSWMKHGVTADRRLIPVVAGIGNHEVKGGYNGKIPDDAPYYYSLFVWPGAKSYFAVDFGEYLSLLVLDSEHTEPVAGAQSEWLASALAVRTRQQHLFVCYHYPAYGTTKAPTEGTPLDAPVSIRIREHWIPHLERFGVTAVFENDHHNYKRTWRIRRQVRDDANGLLFLGDGAWGVEVRTVPEPGQAWWLERAEPRNHLWLVELCPREALRVRAIDAAGVTFDDFEIPRPRTLPEPGSSAR